MKESVFQAEVARSVPFLCQQYERYIEYTKIPDNPPGAGLRFVAKKGYDLFLIDQGRHIAVELKQVKRGKSFNYKDLSEYQEEKLIAATKAGSQAWLMVNFRIEFSTKEQKKRKTKEKRIIKAYAIPIQVYEDSKVWITRESIPLEWFEENAYELERISINGEIGWDLGALIDNKHED